MLRHPFCPFIFIILILLAVTPDISAQVFKGEVFDLKQQPLPDVNVFWINSKDGTTTNQSGLFQLPFPADTTQASYTLICSFQQHTDTFTIDDLNAAWTFNMGINATLKEVKIKDKRTGAYISSLQVIKTEVINRMELRKAACCDLAGCFETQSTVQPQTTNILTNAKELRILGLSGVYNQVLVDGLPIIQGLTYTYGINTIPGSMLDNIWVVKGANSVVQGFENMVGQITVFPREGSKAEPFTSDVLVNSFGEKHLNTGVGLKGKNWTNYMAIHASLPGSKWDRDNDNFMDLPLLTRYSVYNKFRYRNENEVGFSAFVSTRFVDEQRIGGQLHFDPETGKGGTDAYGQVIQFKQPEVLGKVGYRFDANHKISFYASASLHDQQSWFGVLRYQASQTQLYGNLQYEQFWGKNKQHDLKAGISYRHLHIDETIGFTSDTIPRNFAGNYRKREYIPGLFAENIFYLIPDKLTAIAGIRADQHNAFGWTVTPRAMLRYQPFEKTDIRISAGSGWRTVNLFAENINLLTSGRDILFAETLRPERSINTGINVSQKWRIGDINFTASIDAYHTRFSNQFFPDYDSAASMAIIYNFTQPSVSNGFQAEVSADVKERMDIRLAYNYLDVWRKPANEKVLLPFNAKHRLLGVMSMHSKSPLWQIDLNVHYYGVQRLPNTENYPEQYRLPSYSKPFTIVGVQYTHVFSKAFEAFTGCENLFDFRQLRPIVSWENPFSTFFDTSFAFGPTRGREFYIGGRLRLSQKQESE